MSTLAVAKSHFSCITDFNFCSNWNFADTEKVFLNNSEVDEDKCCFCISPSSTWLFLKGMNSTFTLNKPGSITV